MAIVSRSLHIADAPALIAYRGKIFRDNGAPTVLYYHGFTGGKEDGAAVLSALAGAGFLAVGIDNVGHGERRLPNFEQQFSGLGPGAELEARFLTLVRATALEVPSVLDALIASGMADTERIGVAGWSMGGFIAYAAITVDRRVRAATPILGAPEWRLAWPESPHHFPERFFPTALLSQTAGADRRVPPHFARQFHERLTPYYAPDPARLCYHEYEGIGHDVPATTKAGIYRRTIAWFSSYLR